VDTKKLEDLISKNDRKFNDNMQSVLFMLSKINAQIEYLNGKTREIDDILNKLTGDNK
jgi:hypothetical protein